MLKAVHCSRMVSQIRLYREGLHVLRVSCCRAHTVKLCGSRQRGAALCGGDSFRGGGVLVGRPVCCITNTPPPQQLVFLAVPYRRCKSVERCLSFLGLKTIKTTEAGLSKRTMINDQASKQRFDTNVLSADDRRFHGSASLIYDTHSI